jgi:serine/threonine-protein kinase HipA
MAARGEVKNAEALGRMLQQGRLVNGVTQRELAERLDTEVARMLANTQAAPLGNRPKSGRTSLAGVQDKIVLAREDDQWFQVLEGYLSTHIVKPPSARHPTISFDDEYGFRAANAAGLTRFDAWIEKFGDTRG